MHRTEEDKKLRKIKEKEAANLYKTYYQNNQTNLVTCKKCKSTKELSNFLPTYAFKNICKECHKNNVKKWRNTNPTTNLRIATKSYTKNSLYVQSQKINPCPNCGILYPFYMMDFHHIGEKRRNLSRLYGLSKENVDAEIKKCIILCANCHREETKNREHLIPITKNRIYAPEITDIPITNGCETKICKLCKEEKHTDNFTFLKIGKRHTYCRNCLRKKNLIYGHNRLRRDTESDKYIRELKDNKKCTDCGKTFRYWTLDFDHVGAKIANLSTMRNWSIEKVKEEIKN